MKKTYRAGETAYDLDKMVGGVIRKGIITEVLESGTFFVKFEDKPYPVLCSEKGWQYNGGMVITDAQMTPKIKEALEKIK